MYRIALPAPPLRHAVQHYWFLDVRGSDTPLVREAIHVDGCAELVFNFGTPYTRHDPAGHRHTQQRSNVDGPRLAAITIEQPGTIALVGVRFQPGALGLFVHPAVHTLVGDAVPLTAMDDPALVELESMLADAQPNAARQVALLDRALLGRLAHTSASFETQRWFAEATRQLAQSGVEGRVAQVARTLGLSIRSLERRVREQAGITPKALARVGRFQRVLRQLASPTAMPLAQLAANTGYADQAHLTREFQRLAGQSPARYRHYLAERRAAPPPNLVAFLQDDGQRSS